MFNKKGRRNLTRAKRGGAPALSENQKPLRQLVVRDRYLLLMFLPVFIYYIVFCYLPMAGLTMAFQNFKMGSGFLGVFAVDWVGLR